MSALVWNYRGLGGAATVRALAELVRANYPRLVGRMETKAGKVRMERVQKEIGFRNGFIVESRGRSGGLALWWREGDDVTIRSYSEFHIDAVFDGATPFRFTLFYGHPVTSKRGETWDLLRRLKEVSGQPWIVAGDFNEVLFGWEVKGNVLRGEWQMRKFRDVLQDCNLIDLSFKGLQFTYSNRRKGRMETKARLDRAVANQMWRDVFLEVEIWHGTAAVSDHAPLIVRWKGRGCSSRLNLFRFEPMWFKHNGFSDVIKGLWPGRRNYTGRISDCLKSCAEGLESWGRSKFGKVKENVSRLKKELTRVREMERTEEMVEQEIKLCSELDEWLLREELFWKQRSRVDWLKEGDSNTRFFHLRASHRRKVNKIDKLKTAEGVWISGDEELCEAIVRHFGNIFKTSRCSSMWQLMHLLDGVSNRLSDSMRRSLVTPYTELEVQDALFQMCPTKSPGLDGFSAIFYQKNWAVVREAVTGSVLKMLNDGAQEEELNKTLITLVPKKKDPERIEDYRPISLCNVIVKLITKVLVNRLKVILPSVISESQSAFVPGKLISDNILAAHELFHFIKSRKRQKKGYFALKLDMSKAYDRVEWDFLKVMLLKLGFPEVWVRSVMSCICSVKYTIRVNDMLTREFRPERGIRQGDPLSPYLFLICTEWLTSRLRELQSRNKINGVKICREAPEVSHLLFADDSMFFLRADIKNAVNLKEALKDYEKLSGQMINFNKSEIFFSQNVPGNIRESICRVLGVEQVDKISRYLGLPVMFSHNKTELFQFIIEKVWKRVQGWKEKMLSMAGKKILIKAVIQEIPMYAMMCFKIPEALIKRIVSIVSRYWWSNGGEGKGIYWCKFEKLCRSKLEGGLGFRDLGIFNDALLSKQVWRLLKCRESLTGRLLKAKYYKEGRILNWNLGRRPSVAMRNIWGACNKIQHWIEIDNSNQEPIWKGDSSGSFSTRSAYQKLREVVETARSNNEGEQADKRQLTSFWKIIWRLRVQPKVKIFAWRLYYDYLPSARNLLKRGCEVQSSCPLCGMQGESTVHTILECWWAKIFWHELGVDDSIFGYRFTDPGDWLWMCVFNVSMMELGTIVQGARQIWFNRNLVFNGKEGLNPWVAARCLKQRILDYTNQAQKWMVTDPCGELNWQVPKKGYIKFNVDGAWDSVSRKVGYGICGRDDEGAVCLVEAQWLENVSTSQEVEEIALWRAMELAEEKGIGKACFETDCAAMFKTIIQGPRHEGKASDKILRCREMLDRNYLWSIDLIFREANICADKLATEAKVRRWCWMSQEAIPRCLSDVI
ncbi:unnamed protein product [Rhodiola kirilowii]